MDAHTASFRTGSALGLQGALGAGLFGKVDDPTGHKGHFLLSRTANDLPFPIKGKRLLVKAFADPNWPGFAIHFQIIAALSHQMAAQIRPINVQFFQSYMLPIQICTNRFSHTGLLSHWLG